MKQYQNKEWLYQKYWGEGLSSVKMAEICGVCAQTIIGWMKKYKIKRRSMSDALIGKIPWNKKLPKIYNYNCPLYLFVKVWVDDYSITEIADINRTTRKVIHSRLKRFKIKPRSLSNAQRSVWDRPGYKEMHRKSMIIALNTPEAKKNRSKASSGANNGRWRGGASFEPYGLEFNGKLKAFIRKRDNYQCQECKIKENGKAHDCHHIDYCKQNNEPENLITLCNSCHSKTNSKRQYWQNHFEFQMSLKEVNQFIE